MIDSKVFESHWLRLLFYTNGILIASISPSNWSNGACGSVCLPDGILHIKDSEEGCLAKISSTLGGVLGLLWEVSKGRSKTVGFAESCVKIYAFC